VGLVPAEDPDLAPAEAVTCALCGAVAERLPLGWSTSVERGRTVHHCDRCSRDHVRSMEAKLDPAYWNSTER
jgi:hypothetical protein